MDPFFSAQFNAPTPGPQPRDIINPLAREVYGQFGLQRSTCGFFELLDPAATLAWYQPWLSATEKAYELPTLQPFMRTAFGDLFAVPDDNSDMLALICVDTAFPAPLTAAFATVAPAETLLELTVHDEIFCLYNLHRHAFFPGHVQMLQEGPPCPVLGFYPPLVLGGEDDPLTLQVVSLPKHLELLAAATGL